MSSEKLPPIAICSRREKTMMGLNIQRSLRTAAGCVSGPKKMSTRSRCLLQDAVRVYASHRNSFLPEDPIKSSSKKMDSISPRVSSERSLYLKEDLSAIRKSYNSTKLPGSGVNIDSIHSLSNNIPQNVILRRENSKLYMTLKSPRKSKKRSVATFTQLHKLGLDQTLFTNTISNMKTQDPVSTMVANNDTHQKENGVETLPVNYDSPRNVTQKFRVKRSDKECVYPVEFQPNGLPHRQSNMKPIPSIVKDNQNPKVSSSIEADVSIEKSNGTKTIQLIDQLKEVIPEGAKLKSETRDLYPMFDWTQQRKDDMMKQRFLDPVLKHFDAPCSESESERTGQNAKEKGRQFYHDHNKFTPDRRHIELEHKWMSQYRQRYRRASHDITGMRSPSFSPLLNPPPSAMEFNIFDLESLLDLDRPLSPLVPISSDSKPNITASGAPVINGIACQPISTALVWSHKTNPTDTIPNGEIPKELNQSELPDFSSDQKHFLEEEDTGNTFEEVKPTNIEHPMDVIEESVHEHPVEVIIRIIPDDDKQKDNLSGSNNVRDVTNIIADASLGKRTLSSTSSFGNFLNVPRVDMSFENRLSDSGANRSTLRQSLAFSSREIQPGFVSGSKQGRPQTHSPDKQLTTKQQTQDKTLLSNKNIVFISPVL